MRKIKFRFCCPAAKGFVENYNYCGSVEELFEQDKMLIPSQYTGVNDDSGKELYEGDIVQFSKNGFGEILKGIVGFRHGSFCIDIENPKSTLNFLFLHQIGPFKIIGNIFEKDKKEN